MIKAQRDGWFIRFDWNGEIDWIGPYETGAGCEGQMKLLRKQYQGCLLKVIYFAKGKGE